MNILFICLGNICRSPMAEYIMKNKVMLLHLKDITITSAGTQDLHEGEDMHIGTKNVLTKYHIPCNGFASKMVTEQLYNRADYVLVMDQANLKTMYGFFGKDSKIQLITDYCTSGYDYVPDPWYTNNFEQVYSILTNSIDNFIKQKLSNH